MYSTISNAYTTMREAKNKWEGGGRVYIEESSRAHTEYLRKDPANYIHTSKYLHVGTDLFAYLYLHTYILVHRRKY